MNGAFVLSGAGKRRRREVNSHGSILMGIILLASSSGVAAILVIYGTITKGRWGINFDPIACPRCGTPAPRVRQPASCRQAVWGGSTCEACGVEFDKWGKDIASVGPPPRTSCKTESEIRTVLRIRMLVAVLVLLPFGILVDCYLKVGGLPTSWMEVVVAFFDVAIDIVIISATIYLLSDRVLTRRFRESHPKDPTHRAPPGTV
jgi:hypothetical protein